MYFHDLRERLEKQRVVAPVADKTPLRDDLAIHCKGDGGGLGGGFNDEHGAHGGRLRGNYKFQISIINNTKMIAGLQLAAMT